MCLFDNVLPVRTLQLGMGTKHKNVVWFVVWGQTMNPGDSHMNWTGFMRLVHSYDNWVVEAGCPYCSSVSNLNNWAAGTGCYRSRVSWNNWTMGAGCPRSSAVSSLLVVFAGRRKGFKPPAFCLPWTQVLKVDGGSWPGCSSNLSSQTT